VKFEEIYKKNLALAKEISKNFPDFYLAGGTALMLKHKHRVSEDLDFLKEKSFSFLRLSKKVREMFKVEKEERFTDNVDFWIKGIKVSFVFFPFKNIEPLENFKGIKIASDYDIFLNKIYAAGRRIEPKDPFDFAFLYKKYRWEKEKVKKDFEKKFPDQDFDIYLGAILNIEDYPDIDEETKKVLREIAKKWT